MADIPPEDLERIRIFNIQQAQKEARVRVVDVGIQPRERKAIMEKRMAASELERFAVSMGLKIEPGGRHAKHIVAPDGAFMPLPDHGSRNGFATGTEARIKKFIIEHGISSN